MGPLLAAGHDVRAGMRKPTGARAIRFDLDDEGSLAPAVQGCDAAIFLVHGLDRDQFSTWEEQSARLFADTCKAAGNGTIVIYDRSRPKDKIDAISALSVPPGGDFCS